MIGIKPNLVLARSSDSGNNRSELVSGSEYLQEKGLKHYNPGRFLDRWQDYKVYQVCGYDKLAENMSSLIDLQQDSAKHQGKGTGDKVCEKASVDYLINMLTERSLPDRNNLCPEEFKGYIPDSEKFHTLGYINP